MALSWEYLTFRFSRDGDYGKLYLDNGKLYPPTRDNQFRNAQEADEYLRQADLRATVR